MGEAGRGDRAWKSARRSSASARTCNGMWRPGAAESKPWRWERSRNSPGSLRSSKPRCGRGWSIRCQCPPALPCGQRLRPLAISLRSVSHPQEPLPAPQDALPGPGQEHRPTPQPLRPGQPSHRPPLIGGHRLRVSVRRERRKLAAITSHQPRPSLRLVPLPSHSTATAQNLSPKSSPPRDSAPTPFNQRFPNSSPD